MDLDLAHRFAMHLSHVNLPPVFDFEYCIPIVLLKQLCVNVHAQAAMTVKATQASLSKPSTDDNVF